MRSAGEIIALAILVLVCGCAGNPRQASQEEGGSEGMDTLPPSKAGARSLADEARRQLSLVQSTHYKHRTSVDEAVGRFEFDCSGFLAYALRAVAAPAYDEIALARSPDVVRPVARTYHDFFKREGSRHWQRIARVDDLVPGDVVAWLEPPGEETTNTGHVVVVDAAPRAGRDKERIVTVIDSARSGHGPSDTRPTGVSGLGRGPIVLALADDGSAVGFRWSDIAQSRRFDVPIAMARLHP